MSAWAYLTVRFLCLYDSLKCIGESMKLGMLTGACKHRTLPFAVKYTRGYSSNKSLTRR